VVMGQEFCGEVAEIGAGVNGWSIGERVLGGGPIGANVVIDASQTKDPAATFVEQTGVEPSVIFECVGLPGMFQRVIDMAPLRSRVVMVGTCLESESFTVVQAALKHLDVQFTYAYDAADIASVLEIIASGSIDPSPMLSNRTSLDDLPQTIERMLSPNDECKVVVFPS
jgi:threonine dehydrogenase-like Zn-dependent dehydrogenase